MIARKRKGFLCVARAVTELQCDLAQSLNIYLIFRMSTYGRQSNGGALPPVSPHHVNITCPITLTTWRLHPTSQVITSLHPQEMSSPPMARKRAHKAATVSALYSMGQTQWAPLLPVHGLCLYITKHSPCFPLCSPSASDLSLRPLSWAAVTQAFSLGRASCNCPLGVTHNQTSLRISWLCSPSFSDNSNLASCFHS